MKLNRLASRTLIVSIATASCLAAGPLSAQDDFPSKPVEIVIHAKYGGGTDTTARMMMIRTRRVLGADMQVTAKRGGSGAKAHQYALGKPRDGYTVLALTQSHRGDEQCEKTRREVSHRANTRRPIFVEVSAAAGLEQVLERQHHGQDRNDPKEQAWNVLGGDILLEQRRRFLELAGQVVYPGAPRHQDYRDNKIDPVHEAGGARRAPPLRGALEHPVSARGGRLDLVAELER